MQYKILHYALRKVEMEVEKACRLLDTTTPCMSVFHCTLGLPYAHMISDVLASSTGKLTINLFFCIGGLKNWQLQPLMENLTCLDKFHNKLKIMSIFCHIRNGCCKSNLLHYHKNK